jgi:hypothetical protein
MAWAMVSLNLDESPEIGKRSLQNKDGAALATNVLDSILSNLGSHNDGLGPNWSAVERVAHSFHMWDLWMKV